MNKVEPLENEGSSTEPVESASVIEEPNNSIPQPLPPTPNVLISNDGTVRLIFQKTCKPSKHLLSMYH